jgi:hypothetical protein
MSLKTLHKVNDFFESYARSMEQFDSKAIANFYALPCIFINDDQSTAFTDASALEGMFNQGFTFYKQFGIANIRPEVWSKRAWTNRIVKVKVNWQYFDKDHMPVYDCEYQYILKLDKNNNLKIETAVALNEKQRIEEWQQQRAEENHQMQ